MNIFYFNECPVLSAQAQPDKMLVKMPLETAQMLCTAHRELDGDEYADKVGLYKRAYWNHPCTVWARQTKLNYLWLYTHFLALGSEYKFRYGREHASITKLAKPLHGSLYDDITNDISKVLSKMGLRQCIYSITDHLYRIRTFKCLPEF